MIIIYTVLFALLCSTDLDFFNFLQLDMPEHRFLRQLPGLQEEVHQRLRLVIPTRSNKHILDSRHTINLIRAHPFGIRHSSKPRQSFQSQFSFFSGRGAA